MPVCVICREDNAATARFCQACGAPLEQALSAERRKLATVLFCDMAGSTTMAERMDPESFRELTTRYFHEMRSAIERHGGTVEKFIGDAVMSVFGVPDSHEDDAFRAIRAAWEMQEVIASLNEEFMRRFGTRVALRIGVNTGEVVAGSAPMRQMIVTGDAVNVAARLEQVAQPGQILLGELTYRLLRDAVSVDSIAPIQLKGKSRLVAAYRLLALDPSISTKLRLETPMVGRGAELARLDEAFKEVVTRRSCRLVTLVGDAGVGKSRLAAELTALLADQALILHGRCLPYGEGITYWPFGEIVRQAARIKQAEGSDRSQARIASLLEGEDEGPLIAERVAQAVGLGSGTAQAEEFVWAFRRLLEVLSRRRPLLLLVDDIQWGEPALLDLLGSLPSSVRDAPILLLCLARPDLADRRPDWQVTIELGPLVPEEAAALMSHLLGGLPLDQAIKKRVSKAAEGNPFFVQELVAMFLEEDLVRRDEAGWTATTDSDEIKIPPTLSALLGARLARLPPAERSTLEHASIEGEVFHRGALIALSTPSDGAAVDRLIETLVAKALVQPAEASVVGEGAFRFRHILIRDAAYQEITKKLRAELHERFANWLEQEVVDHSQEFEEILGYHFEQAYRYRHDLDPTGIRGFRLAEQAGRWLAVAGKRAVARDDMHSAVKTLDRATSLVPPEERAHLGLLCLLGEALFEIGEFRRAGEVLSEAVREADGVGNKGSKIHAQIVRLHLLMQADPERFKDSGGLDEVRLLIRELADVGDELVLAKAWRLTGYAESGGAEYSTAERAFRQALDHARNAGDRREEARNLSYLGAAAFFGPTPATIGIQICEDVLSQVHSIPSAQANALLNLAPLLAMRARFAEARNIVQEAEALAQNLGVEMNAVVSYRSSFVEALAGDHPKAEEILRHGCRALEEVGERYWLQSLISFLAEALSAQGKDEEAYFLTITTEENAQQEDSEAQSLWRATRAKLLARQGRHDEAQRLGHEAITIVEGGDVINFRADLLVGLAEILQLAKRPQEAASAVSDALELYERKENLVSAGNARALLARLTAQMR